MPNELSTLLTVVAAWRSPRESSSWRYPTYSLRT